MAFAEAGFAQTASSGKAVRLAFVGVGNRGSYHLDCALGIEGVEVAAVCDVDDKALYRAKRWVERAGAAREFGIRVVRPRDALREIRNNEKK